MYNHIFELLIFMPRFNTLIFIKKGLKLSYFCQKKKKFLSAGDSSSSLFIDATKSIKKQNR